MDLTKISLMRPFIISDYWSILCGVYIYIFYIYNFRSRVNILWLCRMEEFRRLHTASGQRLDMWSVIETQSHKHKKRNKPINANTHGFPTGQLWHIYFFRLKWPTLEKHPLVLALEVVAEPKLNTELKNKNFPFRDQKPEQELNSTNSKSHVNQAECAKSRTRHRHRVSNWHQEEHWCSLDWHWGGGGRVAAFLCGLAVLECNLFCVTS